MSGKIQSILFSANPPTPRALLHQVAVTVELQGTYTRGMMVLDYMQLLNKKHKAVILKKVDVEKFKQLLMNSLQ